MLTVGLAGAVVLASSCSLDAAVAVDRTGRVVAVDAVQIRSNALDLAMAMALQGCELVLEFRWGELQSRSALQ